MAWQSVYGMDEDLEEGPRSSHGLVTGPCGCEPKLLE